MFTSRKKSFVAALASLCATVLVLGGVLALFDSSVPAELSAGATTPPPHLRA